MINQVERKINKLLKLAAMAGLFMAMTTGCAYDKEDELYPQAPECDTANVTYSQTIAPIMTQSCNVCHSTTVATAGIVTDNYDALRVIAVNGSLSAAVNHTGPFPMPKDGEKLSDCNLARITKWVDSGTPNN
jgi:cytochrome c5